MLFFLLSRFYSGRVLYLAITSSNRLLPTHHFQVVFTVLEQLRELFNRNRKLLYALLFQCATSALLQLAHDPKRLGTQLGITAVLHTWTRDLRLHPHLHCLVTGGGLKADGQWASTKPAFLFPSKVLGKLFQGKFIHALRTLYNKHLLRLDSRCQPLLCPLRRPRTFRRYHLHFCDSSKKPRKSERYIADLPVGFKLKCNQYDFRQLAKRIRPQMVIVGIPTSQRVRDLSDETIVLPILIGLSLTLQIVKYRGFSLWPSKNTRRDR